MTEPTIERIQIEASLGVSVPKATVCALVSLGDRSDYENSHVVGVTSLVTGDRNVIRHRKDFLSPTPRSLPVFKTLGISIEAYLIADI
jgi:hypothetical protein